MGGELQGGWRWLVIGRFGTASGEPFFIGPGELPSRLEAARVEIEIDVVDRLADDAARRIELLFPRLRSFSTEAVVRAVPLLSELSSLLAHASHSVILDGVERLVGRGRLYRALQAVADPTEAGTRAAPSKEKSLEDVLRAVTQAHADKEQHAARAI